MAKTLGKDITNTAIQVEDVLCIFVMDAFIETLQRWEEFEPHVGYPSFVLLLFLNGS